MNPGGDDAPTRPLVVATHELRSSARGLLVAGAVTLAGGLLTPSLTKLTARESVCGVLVFGLAIGIAGGGLVLGVRTGPEILYRQIFDRAPAPPEGVAGEAPRRTARRAASVALTVAAGLIVAAAVIVAMTLILFGEPRVKLPQRLPSVSLLVAGGWMIALSGVVLWVGSLISGWQAKHGKIVICPALHAGLLRPVYYVAEPADRPVPPCAT